MKFSKLSQLFLVSSIGLLVATLFSACQLVTIDYVFLATSGGSTACPGGQLETYAVDSESGAIRSSSAAVCSGGTTPVTLAVSPAYTDLYVGNQADMSVVHFAVSPSGVLSSKDTVHLSAPPVSLAVSSTGDALYVVSGATSATLTEYALSSGTIGSVTAQESLTIPGYPTDSIVPTSITTLANGGAVYVTAYDASAYNPGGSTTSTANPGWLFGFSSGTGGALTATSGSPYKAGVKPSGLVADPTSRFVYVTDFAQDQLIGYGVYTGYALEFLVNGPYKAGSEPSGVVIDPRGKFIYVSNLLSSSVTAYVIDLTTGTPSTAVNPTGSQTNITDTEPVAVAVDPALGRFVYTANYLGNSISGFRLNPTAGTLVPTQATPYPTGQKPTALVIVPHGNHSLQTTAP
jgi:6-phosphogluconolactonase (cycloisomerase 2 family)